MEPQTSLVGKKIALAGSIGAGKTTIGRKLRDCLLKSGIQTSFFEETLPQALLEKSTLQQDKWMEQFQTVMVMRAGFRELLASKENTDVLLLERPLEESWVFGKANLMTGKMSQEYYDEWYSPLHEEYKGSLELDLIVFLLVDPKTAAKRRDLRGRPSEEYYGDAYTNALTDAYFDWVLECCAQGRMLVVNWIEFEEPEQLLNRIAKALANPEQLKQKVVHMLPHGDKYRQFEYELLKHLAKLQAL